MTIRPAVASDAQRLFEIRRASIWELAPPVMPLELVREWADAHPSEWIYDVLLERAVWVLEREGDLVGWVSATANTIDGLYTSPSHARSGVGSRLLRFAEAELDRLGFSEARLEASVNAEEFYRRRGYEPAGPRPMTGSPYGALPMRKALRDPGAG